MENLYDERFKFKGKLRKFHLISNNICYGPMPAPDDEVEQHLTINDKGRVWFSAYNFGHHGKFIKNRSKNFSVDKSAAERLLFAISENFSKGNVIMKICDVGVWEIELTNSDGQNYFFSGSMGDLEDISEMVRETLGMKDLFVFDENRRNK